MNTGYVSRIVKDVFSLSVTDAATKTGLSEQEVRDIYALASTRFKSVYVGNYPNRNVHVIASQMTHYNLETGAIIAISPEAILAISKNIASKTSLFPVDDYEIRYDKPSKAVLADLIGTGLNAQQLADIYRMKEETIKKYIKKCGLRKRYEKMKDSQVERQRLTYVEAFPELRDRRLGNQENKYREFRSKNWHDWVDLIEKLDFKWVLEVGGLQKALYEISVERAKTEGELYALCLSIEQEVDAPFEQMTKSLDAFYEAKNSKERISVREAAQEGNLSPYVFRKMLERLSEELLYKIHS